MKKNRRKTKVNFYMSIQIHKMEVEEEVAVDSEEAEEDSGTSPETMVINREKSLR